MWPLCRVSCNIFARMRHSRSFGPNSWIAQITEQSLERCSFHAVVSLRRKAPVLPSRVGENGAEEPSPNRNRFAEVTPLVPARKALRRESSFFKEEAQFLTAGWGKACGRYAVNEPSIRAGLDAHKDF